MKQLIFVNSHPIQYFTPLYKYLNDHGIDTSAWYCTDPSLRRELDKQFGVDVKWDIPLLDGYEYKFFKNQSWKPSHFNGFFGLINLEMIWQLFKIPKSVIVVHGWHYFTLLAILILGNLKGHTICLRCDVPLRQENLKHGFKKRIKDLVLKCILFPRVQLFLYIGVQNRLFYKSLGIEDERLISCPYAVDNLRFKLANLDLIEKKLILKEKLKIQDTEKVILFSAKYIEKKRPLDLLKAFRDLDMDNVWLIMVGEGMLREQMEEFIASNKIQKVILTGFVNQSQISEYYSICDLFVMTSFLGENWGLSVNEAMNFNLPLVISDATGCVDDLVKDGVNGFVYETGNIVQLVEKIRLALSGTSLSWQMPSSKIIDAYSFEVICKNLAKILT